MTQSKNGLNRPIRAGVGAVVFREREVLLIRRGKPPFLGQWSIPGGGLEYGERLEDAVAREVREETSVEIEVLDLLGVYESLPGGDFGAESPHYLMIDYIARWRAGEPHAGDDALEAAFAPLEVALKRVAWDETRRAIAEAAERILSSSAPHSRLRPRLTP